ncbi:RNA polymerase sigma factor [Streptomyces mirabilis]|jgi:DNA-directed RNA polymerase specialized sigma24 family protein|uniref:RNA polymerase sigma factor n=1 Tax=Streptomyces mirabilis TaxID=68239 RepID=UPI002255FC93|nr:hypothetical protein [Streptomyces mirabilis]MCX4427029.1 hypothetical protein [Streptomyces mirabilis]
MARAHRHHDGHPDLRAAVFSTVEVHDDGPGQFVIRSELVDLFDAIGQLPHDQMDVAVLHYLCAMPLEEIPDILGLSPAITHAVDHHARATLERLLRSHSPRE